MKPTIYIKDHLTGEETTRQMTDEEFAALTDFDESQQHAEEATPE
jgi:hypothetical protein